MVNDIEPFRLYTLILEYKKNIQKNYLLLGKALLVIHDTKGYKQIAYHISTWDDFLYEVGISHGKAEYLMKIIRYFENYINVSSNKLPDVSRLITLLPYAKGMDDKDKADWIAKAVELNDTHWKTEIQLLKGWGVDRDLCSHDDLEIWNRCRKCGKFLKT